MNTQDLIKIIETSSPRRLEFQIKQIGPTLWQVTGSLPSQVFDNLRWANILYYLSDSILFLSTIDIKIDPKIEKRGEQIIS